MDIKICKQSREISSCILELKSKLVKSQAWNGHPIHSAELLLIHAHLISAIKVTEILKVGFHLQSATGTLILQLSAVSNVPQAELQWETAFWELIEVQPLLNSFCHK